ncbi:MAG: signal peptide peptidase SppA [Sporomusaceae bacterium]|nr:signal peptide peptidase SppA [Sporomusaceae bacterium]
MYKKAVMVVILAVVALSLAALSLLAGRQEAAGGKIALIYVEGVIAGGRGQTSLFADGGGTDALMKQLRQAKDDPSVRAVVLRINSPGGSAPAAQEVGEEVKRLRQAGKPVVASMGDVAASGGYWLAAVSDKIYANPASLTGSIGVYIPYTNWEQLMNKLGVHSEKIKSGPYKDILSPDRGLTAAERDIIQTMVDELYEQFVAVVAEGRNLDKETVRKLADGRVYTGSQAKAAGLVDELGNLYDAIDGARELAGLDADAPLIEFGRGTPWEALFESRSDWRQLLRQQTESLLAPLAVSPLRQVE